VISCSPFSFVVSLVYLWSRLFDWGSSLDIVWSVALVTLWSVSNKGEFTGNAIQHVANERKIWLLSTERRC
jgi:hypothetical protein